MQADPLSKRNGLGHKERSWETQAYQCLVAEREQGHRRTKEVPLEEGGNTIRIC